MATFTVSKKTQDILKNFATISNSIILAEGRSQRTIAKGKAVLALAELPEAWPRNTPIYDLNRFLGTLSIFKTPVIVFDEDRMAIQDGPGRIGFRYSDPSTIQAAPSKTLPFSEPIVKFSLSEASLEQLGKASALLQLGTISIKCENGAVVVGAADAKNPASHDYAFTPPEGDIALSSAEWTRTIAFSTEHIGMLMTGAYEVSVADWNYGYFQHKTEPVAYFIVAQV